MQWPHPILHVRPDYAPKIPGTRESRGAGFSSARNVLSFTNLPGILLRPSFPAGAIPTDIATGDFNGDGRLDWVVSNAGDNSLDLYLGNGDGTSKLPVIIPVSGNSPLAVAVGDLNGDGKLDLVVAEADSNMVGIFFGNGDGTFQVEFDLPALPVPVLDAAIADLNRDGHPDLLVGLAGDSAAVNTRFATLLNDSTGHFGSPIYAPNPNANEIVQGEGFSVADVNGDGILDVLVRGADAAGTSLLLFLGRGDGTFLFEQQIWSSQINPLFESDVGTSVLADVNGDGCPDVTVGMTLGLALVFFDDCSGRYPSSPSLTYGMGDGAMGLVVADMNGDGHPDLVTGGIPLGLGVGSPLGYSTGNTLTVRFGNGAGQFGEAHVFRGDPGMVALVAADLKGDGHPGIISANQNTNSITIYNNDGAGSFGEPQGGYDGFVEGVGTSPTNAPNSALAAADIDGDGRSDLGLLEFPDPGSPSGMITLNVLLNQGNGQFSAPIRTPEISGNPNVRIGDFVFADFRNTHQLDFVAEIFDAADASPTQLIYAKNAGNGHFGPPAVISLSTPGDEGFAALSVGDFNADGKLDIAVATSIGTSDPGHHLTVFLGNGDGTFRQVFQGSFGLGDSLFPTAVFVGDTNADGKLDILVWLYTNVSPASGNDLFEFLGNGDGTFQSPRDVLQNLSAMTMMDLNHDGRLDVIDFESRTRADQPPGTAVPTVTIRLGQVNGSFGSPSSYTPYAGLFQWVHGNNVSLDSGVSSAPYLGDFNGDGNLDLAIFQQPSLANGPAYVQFLAGNGDGTFTPTFDIFRLRVPEIPDLTAMNLLGDGRSAFLQTPNFTSSYQVFPSVLAPSFQVEPVELPIKDGTSALKVSLNVPSPADTTVLLSASGPDVQLPASVTIPAGQVSMDVPFTLLNGIPQNRWFSITANANNETEIAYDFPARAGVDSFTLLVGPPPLDTVQQGGVSELWNAGVLSHGNAAGTFKMSCAGLPSGATCEFQDNLTTVTILGGGFDGLLFSVNASVNAAPGQYTFDVVATDGVSALTAPEQIQITAAPLSLTASPQQLTFGPTIIGMTNGPQTITISNTNASTITSLNLSGPLNRQPNLGTFQKNTTCGVSLGPSASCTIDVSFTAIQAGAVSDQINVLSSGLPIIIPITATAGDFVLQLIPGSPSSQSIQAGQTAVFSLQIAPTLFQGAVSLGCSAAVPHGQCFVSPASANVNGAGVVPFQVTVSTSAGAVAPLNNPFSRPSIPGTVPLVASVLFGIAMLVRSRRRTSLGINTRRVLVVAFFLVCAFTVGGCSGGGSSVGVGGNNNGTPPGTYTITVSGSAGSATRSIALTLIVR
jgi:FG-GAP-like repeat